MTVFIVMKDDKVDEVFDNELSAKLHKQKLIKKWSIAYIVVKNVKSV